VSFTRCLKTDGSLICIKNYKISHELKIAYLSNGSNEIERMVCIMSLIESLKTNRKNELRKMFYGFDKYDWTNNYIGTQSSIAIHNALKNGII
jgi:hypothetical protein